MNMIRRILILGAFFVSTFSLAFAESFKVDKSHTYIGFEVVHLVISDVQGKFKEYEALVDFDLESKKLNSMRAEIEVDSLDTENSRRDKHLKSDDFFDESEFPTIQFQSTKIEQNGNNIKVFADITIKDVTKEVVLDLKLRGVIQDKNFGTRAGFKGSFTIDRRDFGLKWNALTETGGLVVGNEVTILLEMEILQ